MTEVALYEQIAQYMNLKYPGVIYHFDLSGLWTPSHKLRNLYGRLNRRGWPDLFIAQPKYNGAAAPVDEHGNIAPLLLHGLFIELKREGTKIYLKGRHLQEQALMLEALRSQGYKAEFAIGFNEATKLIDEYLNKGAGDDRSKD